MDRRSAIPDRDRTTLKVSADALMLKPVTIDNLKELFSTGNEGTDLVAAELLMQQAFSSV